MAQTIIINWQKYKNKGTIPTINTILLLLLLLLTIIIIIIRLIIKYNSFFIITKIHKDMKKFDSSTNINNNITKSKFNLIKLL